MCPQLTCLADLLKRRGNYKMDPWLVFFDTYSTCLLVMRGGVLGGAARLHCRCVAFVSL